MDMMILGLGLEKFSKVSKIKIRARAWSIRQCDPLPLNWSTPIVRKRRIRYRNQKTQSRTDCNEAKAVEVLAGQGMARVCLTSAPMEQLSCIV
jgi:hypothetical protein